MTISGTLICTTCGNKIRVRYQVGYINPVNVRIGCQGCGKIIKGIIDQRKSLFEFDTEKWDSNYVETTQTVSISTELPVSSVTNENGPFLLTPFLAIGSIVGGIENIQEFGKKLRELQPLHDTKFEKFELITDLFSNNSFDYFLMEAKKEFRPNLSLKLTEYDEFANVLNLITNDFLKLVETDYYRSHFKDTIISIIFEPNSHKRTELRNLVNQLEVYTNLKDEFVKGQALLVRFLRNIKSFLPVVVLSYNNDFAKQYNSDLTITTFDYWELKDMYVEQFEFLARTSSIHFGLLNLTERNDYDDFGSINDCSTLEDYQKKDNGIKKEIIKKSTILNDYFLNTLNNQIRNGIGHLKTKYNPVNQEIKYFPYNKKTKINQSKTISLIDFTYLIYQQALKIRDTQIIIQKLYEKSK